MPKLPRWTAADAEKALLLAAFSHLRSKGSHRIPFHGGAVLHPKIVKQILEIIDEAAKTSAPEE
jgi:predicted RNA binding protein YcfA (HicA-like mRNA interferase family)